MTKLYFAHANGIPADVYASLWQTLQDDYQIEYLPVLAMNPVYPIGLNWDALVQEVLDDMQARFGREAVIGVGHSFGSLLLWRCALKAPERFSQLVLLDPPLVMGYQAAAFEAMQRLRLPWVDKYSPAGVTLKRKDCWDSRAAAAQSLRRNRLFQNFDEQCFADFVTHGLVQMDGSEAVTLRIPKLTEAAIFRHFPSFWWRMRKPSWVLPIHVITATDSPFYQAGHTLAFVQKFAVAHTVIEGGHMFPLEQVSATAALLRHVLAQQAHVNLHLAAT